MKTRLAYILKLYLLLLLIFIIQKPVFMFLDTPEGAAYGVADSLRVVANGLLLDVPMTGYLVALPLLAVIVSCWTTRSIRPRRWMSWYYALISLVVCLTFVADLSLYPFWKFKLDATIFYYIDSPGDAFASVSAGYIVLRVIAIGLCAAAMFMLLRALTPAVLPPVGSTRAKAGCTAFFVAVIVPLAISIRGGVSESTTNIGKVYFSADEYLNHSAVNPCFSMFYSVSKAENYADEFDYFDEDARARLFDGLYTATGTAADTVSLLNTTRPNVLIILMEGFGGNVIKQKGDGPEVTPCYNRLASEGIFFTDCYSNSFRTDRGMVSALSGYPAFPTLSVMKIPVKSRTLPCIANSLNAEGYSSMFLYGGDINFTNMQSYLRTGGYGEIVSDADFTAEEKKDNPWGVNDDVTFDRLFRMMKEQRHGPWHICFLTLSSHEPFEVPYRRLKDKIPNAFAFTDECLGRFIDRLKKTDLWRNLLIVCIPDHGYLDPTGSTHEQHHHNTMLWTGGAVRAPRRITTTMNQSDMAATLLGQLRIDHSEYTFSRDVMSPAYTYPFAFFTYSGGIGFADSTGYTVYDIVGERVLENSTAETAPAAATDSLTAVRTEKAKAILQTFYDDFGRR